MVGGGYVCVCRGGSMPVSTLWYICVSVCVTVIAEDE